MLRNRIRRRGAGKSSFLALSSLFMVLVAVLCAAPAQAGFYYEAITKNQVDRGPSPGDTQVQGWVEGASAKIIFTESDNPMAAEGTYLITTDGGQTIYLVNPKEETYSEWDIEAMLQTANAMLESLGGVVKFSFENVEVQEVDSGSGGEILGYSTKYTKHRTAYDIEVRVLGIKRRSSVETLQEAWSTNALSDEAFGVWLGQQPINTGNEELDELIQSQAQQLDGFPLKTVQVSVNRNKKGEVENRSTVTTEVTKLDRQSIPAKTFEIPSNFTETAAAIPTGEVANDNEEGGEESENPLDSLKGLFKRN
ncbi:MAG: DUF4412 domain-containing protein [Acidobacteriota bacterium]